MAEREIFSHPSLARIRRGSSRFSQEGVLYIMPSSSRIPARAYAYRRDLRHVVVPEAMIGIEDSAFRNCSNLRTVVLPKTLREIGWDAFYDCCNLREIVIPEGVERIGASAFGCCRNLKFVTLPKTLRELENSAFMDCRSLREIVVPEGITMLGGFTFSGCENLETVKLPETLRRIGWGEFWGCQSLRGVSIPKGVTEIGRWALRDCRSLREIVIPEGVTKIKEDAFKGCSSLRRVSLPASWRGRADELSRAGIPGESKTILLAGHNNTFFNDLQSVEAGDVVTIETHYGTYTYTVEECKVLEYNDTSAYDFTRTDENLILYTCYPFDALGFTSQRYFVYASYTSGPMLDADN